MSSVRGHRGHRTPPLREGEWLLTTREGSEQDLVDELSLGRPAIAARVLAPALVAAKSLRRGLEPTFARQGFPVHAIAEATDLSALADRLAGKIAARLVSATHYRLDAWVPDAAVTNPLAARTEALETLLAERLHEANAAVRVDRGATSPDSLPYVQACLLSETRAAAGVIPFQDALSPAPGGRTRMHAPRGKPSRSARKLVEALAWLGTAPGPGDLCVDLGAAPGGWTLVLLERGARVVAVDPARLRAFKNRTNRAEHTDSYGGDSPGLTPWGRANRSRIALTDFGRYDKRLRFVQASAFTYEPDEPADWLFCDMAFRPLDVASLLAKWGRSRWATLLVANFKLPMKRKAEMLARLTSILEKAGWRDLRSKQLYHDRDEVTVTAHR